MKSEASSGFAGASFIIYLGTTKTWPPFLILGGLGDFLNYILTLFPNLKLGILPNAMQFSGDKDFRFIIFIALPFRSFTFSTGWVWAGLAFGLRLTRLAYIVFNWCVSEPTPLSLKSGFLDIFTKFMFYFWTSRIFPTCLRQLSGDGLRSQMSDPDPTGDLLYLTILTIRLGIICGCSSPLGLIYLLLKSG